MRKLVITLRVSMSELRFCHGPYRGKECPVCGKNGRILMNDREVNEISRIMAGVLRHFPERYGLRMDDHGYVRIKDLVESIKKRENYPWLTVDHITALVQTDPRGRYQVNGEFVRAVYGHTVDVDLSDLPADNIPEKLYFQSSRDEESLVREAGISPADKSWVHLSGTFRKAYISGLYHIDDPYVLEIDAKSMISDGFPVYRANSEIYITREVPARYIRETDQEEVTLTEDEKADIDRVRLKDSRRRF